MNYVISMLIYYYLDCLDRWIAQWTYDTLRQCTSLGRMSGQGHESVLCTHIVWHLLGAKAIYWGPELTSRACDGVYVHGAPLGNY